MTRMLTADNIVRSVRIMSARPASMSLRPYQRPIADEVTAKLLAGEPEVLMAGCPGFGKTEVALEIIGRLIAAGRVRRALVLAHGTTVLRTNFAERMHLRRPDLVPHVHVAIPHEERNIEGRFDLVVVDEAHEFYGVDGGMVARIIERSGAKSTLLITGTPSGFIRRGLKPVAFALLDLFQEGFAADARILLATSAYQVGHDQWNKYGELKREVGYGQPETDRTMDRVCKILPSLGRDRSPTIVACRDIRMAEQIGVYLRRKGAALLMSHQEEGDGGENVNAFKSGRASVLIVVRRATLGFDMPSLGSFVDLTGSRNPDRIFQMFCRIVRRPVGGPCPKKVFIKAMPRAFSGDALRFFMTGVLQLADSELFETWDGGSLWRLKVATRPAATGAAVSGGRRRPKPIFESGMMVFGDVFCRLNSLSDVSSVRLGSLVGSDKNQLIQIGSILRTAVEWEAATGIDAKTIRARLRRGVRGRDLLASSVNGQMITIDGITKSMSGWASHVGLSPETIRQRVVAGIRGRKLLDPANGPSSRPGIEIDGVVRSAREWSSAVGLGTDTIARRWRKGIRGARLLDPAYGDRSSITIDGRTLSSAEWAAEAGVGKTTVWQRYRRGIRGEALLAPAAPGTRSRQATEDGDTRDPARERTRGSLTDCP